MIPEIRRLKLKNAKLIEENQNVWDCYTALKNGIIDNSREDTKIWQELDELTEQDEEIYEETPVANPCLISNYSNHGQSGAPERV